MKIIILLMCAAMAHGAESMATTVSREYIKAHLLYGSVEFIEETIKPLHRESPRQPPMFIYNANVDAFGNRSQFTLTLVYSDGKWTALELDSTIRYDSR